ncbi:MAG TPA: 6-phosphogluconolactonase [Mycobacteriales bacterium]|nr:6-phosphogluconolactonase [Cryptosporangiaceae bacterium]MDQ1678173.1 6-phosphogluconolactonase [Actinomycetota bacterium]HEV7756816.1 6-phosphogluconolactonase [Mycobacteriales bacterium]
MTTTAVHVHRDPDVLAAALAARLVSRLVDAQAARGTAGVVLTGGSTGIAVLAALAASPARDAIDWGRLDVWWGDERFLPSGDPERNETQARRALLDAVDIPPERVHPFPASDGPDGNDPEAAAARYAAELRTAAHSGLALPHVDVLMLGVGPDGHVASIFPESPATYEDERPVVAVHGSPKPPPIRLTLTFPVINSADEIWLAAAGAEKADAIGLALAGAGPVQVPAAGVHGGHLTLWSLDRAAAVHVPTALRDQRWR